MIFHGNRLPADHHAFFYFWKSSKIWNCLLLQIIGGALSVKYIRFGYLSSHWQTAKPQMSQAAHLCSLLYSHLYWHTWRNETRTKLIQGGHGLWKTGKMVRKNSLQGKIRELKKMMKIREKSVNLKKNILTLLNISNIC